jgi:hypothetical protein
MSWINRLFGSLRKNRLEDQLNDELEFHLDMRTRELISAGMTPAEARYRARRLFGNHLGLKERTRDMDTIAWIEAFWQDLRYAGRMLAKSAGFTTIAALTLALGIGANTAIFSVVDGVLLRSLPFARAPELVHLGSSEAGGDALSAPEFLFLRDHPTAAFKAIAAFQGPDPTMALQRGSQIEYVKGNYVSESLFRVLEVSPFLGRGFLPDEDRPGGPNVAVLSYGFWQGKLAADSNAIGRQIILNRQNYTIGWRSAARFSVDLAGGCLDPSATGL